MLSPTSSLVTTLPPKVRISSPSPHILSKTAADRFEVAAKAKKGGKRSPITTDEEEEDADDKLLTTLSPTGEVADLPADAEDVAQPDATQDELEEDADDALLTTTAPGGEVEKREAHHTAAQSKIQLSQYFLVVHSLQPYSRCQGKEGRQA